jgi:hypothetical protein
MLDTRNKTFFMLLSRFMGYDYLFVTYTLLQV